jgi:hypothetical protein
MIAAGTVEVEFRAKVNKVDARNRFWWRLGRGQQAELRLA